MLDPGRTTPRQTAHLRARRSRNLYVPQAAPSGDRADRGLSILVDDGDPTLGITGYRLYVESDRYLIRAWWRLTNAQLIRIYIATLTGEPRDLLWAAFGLRCWDDVPLDGGGSWGPGDALLDPLCAAAMVRRGDLLPPY